MTKIEWNAIVPPWLSDSLPQGLMITDDTLTIRVWNRWLAKTSGLAPEQVLGRPLLEVFPELSLRGFDEQYARALRGEPVTLLRRLFGYLIPLPPSSDEAPFPNMQQQARISPVELEGQVVGTITTIEDMTGPAAQDLQLTQTIVQQEESLALLETLISKAPIGFAFVDPTLRFRRINERLAEINGLPAEEHLGRSIDEILPDLAGQQVGLLRSVLESGKPMIDVEIVGQTRARPGVSRSWQVSYYPVQTAGRRRLGVGILVTETTERRRQERASHFLAELTSTLSESLEYETVMQRLCRQLVPFLADWCVIDTAGEEPWGRQTVAVHCNPRKARLAKEIQLRFPPSLEGQGVMRAMLRAGRPLLISDINDSMLRAVLQDERHLDLVRQIGPRSYILAPLMAGGTMIGLLSLARTEDGQSYGQADLALAEEVANRAAMALQNIRLFAAAEQSRKLAEDAVRVRDAFFSIAAHELRTPLTTLLGRAQLLQKWLGRGAGVDERSSRAIGIVVAQAQRLNRMIAALLDVSRIQSGRFSIDPARMNLCNLVRRVADETRPTLSSHTIELSGCDEPIYLLGDEVRLEQVFQNLVGNAVKYSPSGGTVYLDVALENGQALITVRDEGIGIPAEAQGQLFRRFYRADNAESQGISGLGIGLFVVNEIVELHGGSIGLESEVGQGSRFTVRLPVLAAQAG